MTKISLTKRQSDILNFIKERIKTNNIPPSIHEICNHFGIKSTNAVYEVLNVLEKKGHIGRGEKGASRSIQVTHESKELFNKLNEFENIRRINIIGNGEKANPLLAFLNTRGSVQVDINFFNMEGTNYFAHLVEENGMGKDGIMEGDLALVAQGKTVESGKLVAVLAGDKVYIRRIEKYSDGDELIASARGFPKIKIKKGDKSIIILGKVIGFLKKV